MLSPINNSPEKSIFNDTWNVVFRKSWKHTAKYSSTNAYLSRELGLWLEKLHKKAHGQVPKYVNENQLGANPLVPGDILYKYVMDELNTVVKL
jgi:hypothetical protein